MQLQFLSIGPVQQVKLMNFSLQDLLSVYFESEFWVEVYKQYSARGFMFALCIVTFLPIVYFQLWFEKVNELQTTQKS